MAKGNGLLDNIVVQRQVSISSKRIHCREHGGHYNVQLPEPSIVEVLGNLTHLLTDPIYYIWLRQTRRHRPLWYTPANIRFIVSIQHLSTCLLALRIFVFLAFPSSGTASLATRQVPLCHLKSSTIRAAQVDPLTSLTCLTCSKDDTQIIACCRNKVTPSVT